MKCKCVNQRIDQLAMDMKQVKHAITAMLDTPKSKERPITSTPHPPNNIFTSSMKPPQFPPSTNPPQNALPTPPGTSSQPVRPHRPRHGQTPPQSTYPPSRPYPSQEPHPNAYPQSRHLPTTGVYPNPLPPRPTAQTSYTYMPTRNNYTPRQRSSTIRGTQYGHYGNPSYASVVCGPPTLYSNHGTGCEYCGEPNHRAQTCRHGIQLQCRRCSQFGHKEKYCIY